MIDDRCKYSTILFDLDGTLRFNRPSGIEIFVTFLAEHGICLAQDLVRAGERWAHAYWADAARVNADMACYDDKAFWLNYTAEQLRGLGVDDPDGRLAQAVHAAFDTRYEPEVYLAPSAREVLGALRSRGYTLGLVSNRANALAPLVAELGLAEYFSFTLASGEIDIWKPDPRIFWHACQLGGCDPHASAYVGDNFYADVLGAQAAGLTPVLYDPRDLFLEAECRRIKDLTELLDWPGLSSPRRR